MAGTKDDRSTWAIGGGVLLGVGMSLSFLGESALAFVGSILAWEDWGLGLMLPRFCRAEENRNSTPQRQSLPNGLWKRARIWHAERDQFVGNMPVYLAKNLSNTHLKRLPGAGHLWIPDHTPEVLRDLGGTEKIDPQPPTALV